MAGAKEKSIQEVSDEKDMPRGRKRRGWKKEFLESLADAATDIGGAQIVHKGYWYYEHADRIEVVVDLKAMRTVHARKDPASFIHVNIPKEMLKASLRRMK